MTKKPAPLDTAAIERATQFDATIFLGTGRFQRESHATLEEARKAAIRLAEEVHNGRKGMVYAIGNGRSVFVPDTYHPTQTKEHEHMITTKPKKTDALSGQQIAQLTAMITGGGYKRANSRDAAIKRFENVAAERGIATARILGAGTFEQAKSVLAHSLKTTPAKASDTPAPSVSKAKASPATDEIPLPEIDAAMGISHKPVRVRAVPVSKAKAEKPAGKRAAILEAAQRGEIPAAPDFTAPTHARFRKKLAEIVAMVEAGDVAGLKATVINPVSSSPKAMAKYRDLAVIALEAQAAAKKVAA